MDDWFRLGSIWSLVFSFASFSFYFLFYTKETDTVNVFWWLSFPGGRLIFPSKLSSNWPSVSHWEMIIVCDTHPREELCGPFYTHTPPQHVHKLCIFIYTQFNSFLASNLWKNLIPFTWTPVSFTWKYQLFMFCPIHFNSLSLYTYI